MTARTYDELFTTDLPHLGIDFDAPGRILPWLIIDRRTDHTHYKTADLPAAIQFIQTAVAKGDATVDEDSVEYWRMWRAQLGYSVDANRAWRAAFEADAALSERGKSEAAGTPSVGPSPRSESRLATDADEAGDTIWPDGKCSCGRDVSEDVLYATHSTTRACKCGAQHGHYVIPSNVYRIRPHEQLDEPKVGA